MSLDEIVVRFNYDNDNDNWTDNYSHTAAHTCTWYVHVQHGDQLSD